MTATAVGSATMETSSAMEAATPAMEAPATVKTSSVMEAASTLKATP